MTLSGRASDRNEADENAKGAALINGALVDIFIIASSEFIIGGP